MIIEMISTGDEVLQGDIVDTNAAWAGQLLNEHGLKFARRQTVSDDIDDICRALAEACQRADWLLVNGGLGPTTDDLSAEAASRLTGEPLCLHQPWLDKMADWYQEQGMEMPQSNIKQAMLPQSALCIDNPVGTACGFLVRHLGCQLLFTPGVPSEFKRMVKEQWLPRLIDTSRPQAMVKRFYSLGLSESAISDRLSRLTMPEGVRMGYRSERPSIEVKVFADGSTSLSALTQYHQQVRDALGEQIFSEDQGNWSAMIQALMIEKNLRLVVAESCTGGLLASQLVQEPGSSAYLDRGFVTYSNDAKIHSIGVPQTLIEESGAVSEPVAVAMAQGALKHSHADIALSITGIAGPEGGTPEKPVGTVCFALATETQVASQTLKIANRGRTAIRINAAAIALDMLRRYLLGKGILGDYELFQRQ